MKKEKTPLSASRIKTLDSCSWYYWTNYHLKLPDKSNAGAIMGSACHNIYEYLGKEKHKKLFNKLHHYQTIKKCPAIERYIRLFLKKEGLDPNGLTVSSHGEEIEHIELIDRMLIEGINYDFFGEAEEIPEESFSEIDFDIEKEEGDISYRVRGFIDKLFLYKDKTARIRDFKSSKRPFEGKDIDDNVQDIIYQLAVRNLKPKYVKRIMEFVFLQYPCDKDYENRPVFVEYYDSRVSDKTLFVGSAVSDFSNQGGVLKMETLSDDELEGFEYFLTDIQKVVDNFDIELAQSNFAKDKGFLHPYEGFGGIIKCGAKVVHPSQKKKDGITPAWFCPQKFAYYYYVLLDSKGKIVKSEKLKKDLPKPKKNQTVEKRFYGGCPAFSYVAYNQEMRKKAEDKGFEIDDVYKEKPVDSSYEFW